MLKFKRILNSSVGGKTSGILGNLIQSRTCTQKSYFVSDDEIMEDAFNKFVAIGINMPETKNLLTETALERLNDKMKEFERNDDVHVAILHGCGGNFSAGIVDTDAAVELGQNLLKTLHTLKKPIIASLDGRTLNFAVYIALMCDIRIMENNSLMGLYNKAHEYEIPPFVYKRMLLNLGLAHTTELLCARQSYFTSDCLTMGFISKVAEPGCGFGVSVALAQNICMNSPMEKLVEQKSKLLSFIE